MFRINLKSSNSNIEKYCKIAIFLFPIFFISVLVFNKIIFGPGNISYFMFLAEDGPIEYSTSIFYFLSSVFSILVAINFLKVKKKTLALLYILLSSGLFFMGAEEISWGQRILLVDTPEFFADNLQNEITFHNFPQLHNLVIIGYFLVGLIGSFSWIIFSKTNKLKSFKKFFIPQPFLMSYFVPIFLFVGMLAIRSFGPTSSEGFWFYMFHWRDMEALEFLLSVGIFLFVISKIILWYNLNSQSNLAKSKL